MADEDILTFEQLKDIQNTEQDEDTLGDLDDAFFERVRDYLDRKQRIGGHLNDKEYRNAKHIVRDILDSRQKKIIRLAFLSTKSDIAVDNLLPEEEILFDKVRESITEHRDEIEDQLFGDEDGEETDDTEEAIESTGQVEDETADSTDEGSDTDDGKDQEQATGDSEADDDADTDDDEQKEVDAEADTDDEQEDDAEPDPASGDEGAEESGTGDDDGELLFGGGEDSEDTDDEDGPDERTAGDIDDREDGDDEQEEKADDDDNDTEDGEEMVEVRMTADVSEFMGVDLQSYGPFEEGETATIPDENAEVLQDQDKAEPLE